MDLGVLFFLIQPYRNEIGLGIHSDLDGHDAALACSLSRVVVKLAIAGVFPTPHHTTPPVSIRSIMADSSMSGAESNIRKPESPPPPIVPQAKKLKKEAYVPPPMNDESRNSRRVYRWPFPDKEYAIGLVDFMMDGHPLDQKWLGDLDSRAREITDVALFKADKEYKEGNLSAKEAIGVFSCEAERLIDELYYEQEALYTAKKNEISSIGGFYKSQHEAFFATFGEYFQSPEATQALLSDEANLYSFLVEQHPKLMEMLKEKQEKLEKL